MLVITRKEGESFRVGAATIQILQIMRGRIRLGVTAPREVNVLRSEIYEANRKDLKKEEGNGDGPSA